MKVLLASKVEGVYLAGIETRGGHGYVQVMVLDDQLPPGVGFRREGRDGLSCGIPVLVGTFSSRLKRPT